MDGATVSPTEHGLAPVGSAPPSIEASKLREPHERRLWLDLAILASLPAVVLVMLGVSPYFRLNNGDPFIYVGYSNAFESQVWRFGYTYHSVRFSLIFPLRASLVLGPVWGYFVLRHLLYMVVIVPMWAVMRPAGRWAAFVAPVIFVSSPVAAQAILTTHHDTIVVPFVSSTVCLLVLAVRAPTPLRLVLLSGAAGLCAGIAVNANIFSAPLLMLVTLVVCGVVTWRKRYRDAVVISLLVLAGTIAVCVVGMLVYEAMFGDANIYETTFNAVRDVSNNNVWRTPSLEWLSTRRYAFSPFFALIFGGVVLLRLRRHAERLSPEHILIFGCALIIVLYYLGDQFVREGTSIEQAYYYSFLIGPISLLTGAAIAWQNTDSVRPQRAGFRQRVVVLLPILLAYVSQVVDIGRFVVFLVIVALLLVLVARSRSALAGVAVLMCMHLAWGASPRSISAIEGADFQYEPHYERVFGDRDRTAFDTYLLASRLPSYVPSEPGRVVPLYFWYRTGDAMLDSVQATYHWQALTVQQSPGPGMPTLSPGDTDRIRAVVGGFVILLGDRPGELAAGVDALKAAGFSVDETKPAVDLREGDLQLQLQAVRILAAPQP